MENINKTYSLSIDDENDILRLEAVVKVGDMDFVNKRQIPFGEAMAIFRFVHKNFYISRGRKISCDCLDGAYDNCEVCCPDSFRDFIFKGEI